RRREYRRAELLGELDRSEADPARPAVDQRLLALAQAPAVDQVVPDGEVVLRQARGFERREPFRYRQAEARPRRAVFGVSAARGQRANGIADLQGRNTRAKRYDRARDLEPDDRGCVRRWRIRSRALRAIRPVDARMADLDQHFAFLRRGQRSLG